MAKVSHVNQKPSPSPASSSYSDYSNPSDTKNKKHFARNAANARERTRMRVLSKAFNRLKNALPWVPSDTKLSKLDTLRLASGYISHLRRLLQSSEESEVFDFKPLVHRYAVSWPFLQQQHLKITNQLEEPDDTSTMESNSTGESEATVIQYH